MDDIEEPLESGVPTSNAARERDSQGSEPCKGEDSPKGEGLIRGRGSCRRESDAGLGCGHEGCVLNCREDLV